MRDDILVDAHEGQRGSRIESLLKRVTPQGLNRGAHHDRPNQIFSVLDACELGLLCGASYCSKLRVKQLL